MILENPPFQTPGYAIAVRYLHWIRVVGREQSVEGDLVRRRHHGGVIVTQDSQRRLSKATVHVAHPRQVPVVTGRLQKRGVENTTHLQHKPGTVKKKY